MNLHPSQWTPGDALGIIGTTLSAISPTDAVTIIAGGMTIVAVTPLAIWRWTALIKGKKTRESGE